MMMNISKKFIKSVCTSCMFTAQTRSPCVDLQVLLLDLPAPAPHHQEKLLIDLTNTPDLIRTNNKTCAGAQVIFVIIIIMIVL